MPSINRCTLLGHIGNLDLIESKKTAILKFSLATNEFVKGGESRTDWHNVVVFGNYAKLVFPKLKKGALVLAEGQIRTSKYTNKKGDLAYSTQIVANLVAPFSTGATIEQQEGAPKTPTESGIDDDCPF